MDNGTPRTDRKRGVPERTRKFNGDPPPIIIHDCIQGTTSSPPPLCSCWVSEWEATGERVGVSPGWFCRPSLPRWPISNFRETEKQTYLQLANYDVYPSWVGACFLQHEVLIMAESLYGGLISVALFVCHFIALCTHPVKDHFSLLCLCSARGEICPRGTYGLGCRYGYGKPPSLFYNVHLEPPTRAHDGEPLIGCRPCWYGAHCTLGSHASFERSHPVF